MRIELGIPSDAEGVLGVLKHSFSFRFVAVSQAAAARAPRATGSSDRPAVNPGGRGSRGGDRGRAEVGGSAERWGLPAKSGSKLLALQGGFAAVSTSGVLRSPTFFVEIPVTKSKNGTVSKTRAGLGLAVLILTGFFHQTAAFACLCSPVNLGYAFDGADAVFVGTVVDETIIKTVDENYARRLGHDYTEEGQAAFLELMVEMRDAVRWTVRVDEPFKGVTAGEIVYFIGAEPRFRTDCDRALSVGDLKLFYAPLMNAQETSAEVPGAKNFAVDRACGRTRDVERAKNDLHWLRAVRQQPHGGYIFGHISLDDRMRAAAEDGRVRVELNLNGKLQAANRLDGEGRFSFEDLGSGQYEVAFVPPESLDPNPLVRTAVLRHDHDAYEIGWTLGRPTFELYVGGRMEGRLLDREGRPASDILVTSSSLTDLALSDARTDREGRYTVQHVRPGTHVLWVEFDRGAAEGHIRLYFPGTSERTSAWKFTIGPGDVLAVPDMTIPIKLQPCEIQGVVVDEEGHPVAGANVGLGSAFGYSRLRTDENGEFSMEFSVHREHRLVTCRSVNRGRGQGTSFFGASLVIPVGTCPADPLTLVLKAMEDCP